MRRWLIALLIGFWAIVPTSGQTEELPTCGYTAAQVIAAYEAGQFRLIMTQSDFLYASPDGAYVFAQNDGLYRISDGSYFKTAIDAYFSRDGHYLYQMRGDGIYRVDTMQQVVATPYERIIISNGEHAIWTGDIGFSPDGAYVAVTGAGRYREETDKPAGDRYGVFRLSDGQHMIASDSFVINFSPNSRYAAMQEGVFRLSDGQKLFEITRPYGPPHPDFSPDSDYVYASHAGVYRIADGEKLFDLAEDVRFTPDGQYAVDPSNGVYRLFDGQQIYPLDHFPVYGHPPQFNVDGQYMAIPDNDNDSVWGQTYVYRVADGALLFTADGTNNYAFSPDGSLIAINADGLYQLSDSQKLFAITGAVNYGYPDQFSPDGVYFVAGEDGIYRVADGQKLINIDVAAHEVMFSPNNETVTIAYDGVYRLSDQQLLFTVESNSPQYTQDSGFVQFRNFDATPENYLYRVADGQRFDHIKILHESCGLLHVGTQIVVIEAEP